MGKRDAKIVISASDKTKIAVKSAESNFNKLGASLKSMLPVIGLVAGAAGIGRLISQQAIAGVFF